jgi:transposase
MTLDDLESKMIKMYYQGFSIEEIARKFKVSVVYVQTVFKKDYCP